MCFFPKAPAVPPVPAPPPDPPTDVDPGVQQARASAKRKAIGAQGYSSTILTGPGGDTSRASTTGGKVLLGQ
ncbi:MAG: hypothetical protein KIT67_05770 [Alphaproteobacteria bacterium]|nr:hypothetical protein [Alphaproteobacteria bacterium]